MQISVDRLRIRDETDPDYADFWLEIGHTDSGIRWEVPLNKEELKRLYPSLPKFVKNQTKGAYSKAIAGLTPFPPE